MIAAITGIARRARLIMTVIWARIVAMKAALNAAKEHPLIGVGAGALMVR